MKSGLNMLEDFGMKLIEIEAANVASVSITVQIVMLVFTFIVGHLLKRRKIMVVHEAGAALFFGVLVGLLVRISGGERGFKDWINFNNSFFFYFLLPPIIFESGWSLRSKPFFGNFGAICAFAFGGTLISAFGVGILIFLFGVFGWTYSMPFLVCLAFGALISATDPVTVLSIFNELGTDANLYAYVFGESVLNDAVAIVMYKTVLSFITGPISDQGVLKAISFFIVIFVGSFSTGVFSGMLSALLFKYGGFREKGLAVLESCLVVLFPYLAYNIADALELSGIVSILFAGITMKYYTAPNLSLEAQKITTSFFQMLSKLSETFVFNYIGLGMFLEQQSWHNIGFTFFTIISILVARIWNVYPCSALVNHFRDPLQHIRRNQQHALWFSGLRGAMAFALARQSVTDLPSGHGHVLLTATLLTIFFTVLVIGGLTSTVLNVLKIESHGPDHDEDNDEEENFDDTTQDAKNLQLSHNLKTIKHGETSSFLNLTKQKDKLVSKLKQFKTDTSFTSLDTKYLKPFLRMVPVQGSEQSSPIHSSNQYLHEMQSANEDEMDPDECAESQGLLKGCK